MLLKIMLSNLKYARQHPENFKHFPSFLVIKRGSNNRYNRFLNQSRLYTVLQKKIHQ